MAIPCKIMHGQNILSLSLDSHGLWPSRAQTSPGELPFPSTNPAAAVKEVKLHRKNPQVQTKATIPIAVENLGSLGHSPVRIPELNRSKSVVTVEQYTTVLSDLFRRVNYKVPLVNWDPETWEANVTHFESVGLPQETVRKATNILATAASTFGDFIYPSASRATRTYVDIFTTYLILIDDMDIDEYPDLLNFRYRLQHSLPQRNPVLEKFVIYLLDLEDHLGKWGSDMVFKAVFDFVSATGLEVIQNLDLQSPPAGARRFPEYFRNKTGISEAYAAFVFPVDVFPEEQCLQQYLYATPEIVNMFNTINDVLSFYKEAVVGDERSNFMDNLAICHRISSLEALEMSVDSITDSLISSREVLSGKPALLKHLEEFVQGYISWHYYRGRYRMDELPIAQEFFIKVD